MLIICPHCETQFQVADSAIGEGRTVRCAQCKGSWFAAPEPVFAEAEAAEAGDFAGANEAAPAGDWGIEPETVEESPSIAVDGGEDAIEEEPQTKNVAPKALPRLTRKLAMPAYRLPRSAAIALVVTIAGVIALVTGRESVVRLMPDVAGVYAAVGLPVNLRGLEFRNVKTVQEMQDGIPVLVIEGEVVNIQKHPVEVPRVRIAVLGPSQQELYSWTTLLKRSILGASEKVSFKSRLASPPQNGKEVLVRFLTRSDLTGNM